MLVAVGGRAKEGMRAKERSVKGRQNKTQFCR